MTIYLAPFVAIVGVLLYCLPTPPKVAELGRIAFAFGLLVFLMAYGMGRVHF
jgi:hypothetical protein